VLDSRVVPTRLPTRQRIVFGIVTVVLALVSSGGVLLIVDLYLHYHLADSAGYNIWGYRGTPAGLKKPGELRVIVLGGSTAFGYGTHADEAFPAYLQQRLVERRRRAGEGPAVVVNLAFNRQGAYSFRSTLEDYRYLDADVTILYEGYNDLMGEPNQLSFRHDSAIFQLTGYLPIFPMAFREKADALLHGGLVREDGNRGATTFRPNLANRVSGRALEQAGLVAASLERQLAQLRTSTAPSPEKTAGSRCPPRWAFYCQAVADAIETSLAQKQHVVVVTQPYIGDIHREQQAALAAALDRGYGGDPRVRYVNLGDAIDLKDPAYCYDGMHLLPIGNQLIADRLVDAVWSLR
jgi:hypothetical protein